MISNGVRWVSALRVGVLGIAYLTLFAIASTPRIVNAQITDDTIILNSATFNGQTLNTSDPVVTVDLGDSLTGTINFTVYNSHDLFAVFPVGAVWSWGDHETSYTWLVGSAPPQAATTYNLPLDGFSLPTQPGTYFFSIVAAAEITFPQVASATHWFFGNGSPVWNNGDDVAAWTESQIDFVIANGYLLAPALPGAPSRFGAAAFKVQVQAAPTPIPGVPLWGLISMAGLFAALFVWRLQKSEHQT